MACFIFQICVFIQILLLHARGNVPSILPSELFVFHQPAMPAFHASARCLAFDRAAHLLLAGLARIPSFPHKMLAYLWCSLVTPVSNYGMELFSFPSAFHAAFAVKERKWWRRLLQVGSRSPNTTVQILIGLSSCPMLLLAPGGI